ncbi:MAG: DnaJ domain-containing protein [Deltaproteobacteria bacterium]|nr:DnaJ domain-containing protein [Deltaproteobacteria bacterium]
MKKDFYAILGVSRDANGECIRRAYRERVRETHPDGKSDEPIEAFIEVQEAYETLRDRCKRAEYDRFLDRLPKGATPDYRRRPYPRFSSDPESSYVNDLLKFFSSWVDTPQPAFSSRSGDEELFAELILSPREAEQGVRIPVEIPIAETCASCFGSRRSGFGSCPDCMGRGQVVHNKEVILSIPPAVKNNMEIRFPLAGAGIAGRLHCLIRVR